MDEKLTVLITCKNEEEHIEECIEAIRPVADEILIADSGSTDKTLEIVERVGGCRVIEREYVAAGDFKNWAIPQASNDWVLIVDADERITSSLATEIQQTLKEPKHNAYWVYRANYIMGHRVRFGGWQSDRVVRLFRRDLAHYEGDTDHAVMHLSEGKIGRLQNRMKHYTYSSFDQYFRKFHRYTIQRARCWHAEGRHPSFLKMLLSGPCRFLYTYLFRLGFLDGLMGLQMCALTGVYSFMKHVRLWELHYGGEDAWAKLA